MRPADEHVRRAQRLRAWRSQGYHPRPRAWRADRQGPVQQRLPLQEGQRAVDGDRGHLHWPVHLLRQARCAPAPRTVPTAGDSRLIPLAATAARAGCPPAPCCKLCCCCYAVARGCRFRGAHPPSARRPQRTTLRRASDSLSLRSPALTCLSPAPPRSATGAGQHHPYQ